MVVFPNCKINLGLHIISKRSDGYHELETVFYPLPLYDALEVIRSQDQVPSKANGLGKIKFTGSGISSGFVNNKNICLKAFSILEKDFPRITSVKIHLHKAIPIGGGLGGGSTDGTFTLLLLNKEFNLSLSQEQLQDYALQLGSDCPFFIANKPSYATGRGEKLEPIELDLSNYKFVLVNPGININTAWTYSKVIPATPDKSIREITGQPVETWKETLTNDFEPIIFNEFPEIGLIKKELYKAGAIFSLMSGSGSTMFGIFEKDLTPVLKFPEHYFIRELIGQPEQIM